jgi:hypothetical protein
MHECSEPSKTQATSFSLYPALLSTGSCAAPFFCIFGSMLLFIGPLCRKTPPSDTKKLPDIFCMKSNFKLHLWGLQFSVMPQRLYGNLLLAAVQAPTVSAVQK